VSESRIPPHSTEAEQSVLGSLILDPTTFPAILERIGAEDFYEPDCRTIFTAICELHRAGTPADALLVCEHLRGKGLLGKAGGASAVVDIMARAPSAANAEYYAGIVEGHARRRRVIEEALALADAAQNPTCSPEKLAVGIARVNAAGDGAARPGDRPVLVRTSDVQPRDVGFLWEPCLPRRTLVILAGDPGVFKSTMTCCFTASVTAGLPWPDGSPGPEPANVLLLNAEDARETVVRPRLDAAEAEPSRVTMLTSVLRQGRRAPGGH